jgi:hypothetical protein
MQTEEEDTASIAKTSRMVEALKDHAQPVGNSLTLSSESEKAMFIWLRV